MNEKEDDKIGGEKKEKTLQCELGQGKEKKGVDSKLVNKEIEETRKDKKQESKDQVFPDVKPGCVVRVYQKIKDVDSKGKERERIQVFEGLVLARRHGKEPGATITVRKVSGGVGVEKIFPLALPQIEKIEVVNKFRTRRAKLFYTRDYKKKMREVKKLETRK